MIGIKDMEMPENCKDCRFYVNNDFIEWCYALQAVPMSDKECPLVEVLRWIPCSERMPDEDINVLIKDDDGDVNVARYEYNSWAEDPDIEWWSDEYRVYPTAWMPLPEPYKEEE